MRLAAAALAALVAAASASAADRIVTLGGDATEIVFALGAGERIVATDTTSTYPPETSAIPKLGYLRALSAEGIVAQAPDLVIASADAGPPPVLAQLAEAGMRVERLPGEDSIDGVLAKIDAIGALLGRAAEADALEAAIRSEMEAVAAAVARRIERPRALFALSTGQGGLLAGGRGTAAGAMIRLAGGVNAADAFDGFKPLTPEAAIAAGPDVLILPAHVVEALGGLDAVRALPEIALTPAGRDGRIVVMDAQRLLGFGPRTPEAAAELARALHPGLDLAAR